MTSSLRKQVLRWGPALIMMALIFFASATPGTDLPKFGIFDFVLKKTGHMAGYALLGIAYLRGLSDSKAASRRQLLLAVIMAVLYATTDEFHQGFTPGRTPALFDVGIDAVGAAAGVTLRTAVRSS